MADYYFKLDPNIRNPTEILFGRMEIEGLVGGKVEPIRHFYDVMKKRPISLFDNELVRIQDYLLNLRTAYGDTQGFHFKGQLTDLSRFIERLAYTREIYACLKLDSSIEKVKKILFPHAVEGKNCRVWEVSAGKDRYALLRIITNMFFLEQLNNVVLCSEGKTGSRQIERMDENLSRLMLHIMDNIRRYVPKFPKDYNWKEFEDFVDEPKEVTLYLTQFYGPPYKAKFHPRMIRALLNFAEVTNEHVTGDFMLGSGTLAIESVLLNLETRGSDINPLSRIVTNAKINALSLDAEQLLAEIERLKEGIKNANGGTSGAPSEYLKQLLQGKEELSSNALFLNRYIRANADERFRDFFLCGLASVVSDASKMRINQNVFQLLDDKLWEMWKMVYCLNSAKRFLHLPIGKAEITVDDCRTLSSTQNCSVDLIVTSPPYSTAIDYVKMDLAQLVLLELINSPRQLEENMIGTQRATPSSDQMMSHIKETPSVVLDEKDRFPKLPTAARQYILDLEADDNPRKALVCYKFLYDMWDALKQMHRVLKVGGKCIIIIGNNTFTMKGEKKEFHNGDFLEEMALTRDIGFSRWCGKIVREYSKSSYGTILKEDIIFLKK